MTPEEFYAHALLTAFQVQTGALTPGERNLESQSARIETINRANELAKLLTETFKTSPESYRG
jgi:hypothetical protein